MGKTNPGGVQGLGQLSFFQSPNKKHAPVTCTGHWVNNQTAVMDFGSWLLQSSQKALQEDPSRFFATVSAVSSAFTHRKPKTNVEKEIIFYLIIVKFLNTYVQNTNRKNVRHKVILKHFLKVLNNGSTTV